MAGTWTGTEGVWEITAFTETAQKVVLTEEPRALDVRGHLLDLPRVTRQSRLIDPAGTRRLGAGP